MVIFHGYVSLPEGNFSLNGPMTWSWGYLDFGKQPKNETKTSMWKINHSYMDFSWKFRRFSTSLRKRTPGYTHHSNDVLMYLIQPRSFNRDMRGISSYIFWGNQLDAHVGDPRFARMFWGYNAGYHFWI